MEDHPREQVVRDIVTGIERRADTIISPETNALAVKMPGVFRTLVEGAGFHGTTGTPVGRRCPDPCQGRRRGTVGLKPSQGTPAGRGATHAVAILRAHRVPASYHRSHLAPP